MRHIYCKIQLYMQWILWWALIFPTHHNCNKQFLSRMWKKRIVYTWWQSGILDVTMTIPRLRQMRQLCRETSVPIYFGFFFCSPYFFVLLIRQNSMACIKRTCLQNKCMMPPAMGHKMYEMFTVPPSTWPPQDPVHPLPCCFSPTQILAMSSCLI